MPRLAPNKDVMGPKILWDAAIKRNEVQQSKDGVSGGVVQSDPHPYVVQRDTSPSVGVRPMSTACPCVARADYKQVWHWCGREMRRATAAVCPGRTCLCREHTHHVDAVLCTSLGTGKKDGTTEAEMGGSVCRSCG